MGGCCCSSRKAQFHGTPVYYYYPQGSEEHDSLTSHDVFGRPESTDPQSGEVTLSAHTLEKPSCIVLKEANCLKETEILPISPRKVDLEFFKSEPLPVSTYEDDPCPTCLEEYDKENPKILTKCCHHFHLSCILEWKERSNTCPICDQEMIYERL
ncbi:putative E3 ubiquitin-protein ligase RHB1A isoform X2 [Primulina tabacum]|uniref:putative E3 ubiquitin-protein ligase RHB1A isoform X2 n=1 Tax=Primulina tabacum TaxID=48773 RepID=UPI003F5A8FBE